MWLETLDNSSSHMWAFTVNVALRHDDRMSRHTWACTHLCGGHVGHVWQSSTQVWHLSRLRNHNSMLPTQTQDSSHTQKHNCLRSLWVQTVDPPWTPRPKASLWTHLHGLGGRVQRDEEHLHDALLADGKRDAQVAEGVKGHRNLAAFRTNQSGLEEAVELVDDHGVVPPEVVPPRLSCHLLTDKQPALNHYSNG